MSVIINNATLWQKVYIRKIVRHALKLLRQSKELRVEISFVDNDTIRQLNAQYRNIDRATDVLSFPALDLTAGEAVLKERFTADIDFATNEVVLGEIYIDKEIAVTQAQEYGHSVKREICFLVIHGLLHLLGYDHIEPNDASTMETIQRTILNNIGIVR